MTPMHRPFSTALALVPSLAVFAVALAPWPKTWASPRSLLSQSQPRSNATATTILQLTNQERQRNGKSVLTLNHQLSQVAQRHAEDMARSGQFSHTGSNGSRLVDRVKASGYRYRAIAENLFMQSPHNQPKQAIAGWLKSPGHRANLLNGVYTQVGIGYAMNGDRHYYIQVFGTPAP